MSERDLATDESYQSHPVFSSLKKAIAFYDEISLATYPFVTSGTSGRNIDTYHFSSIKGTINSIDSVLRNGQINDAYALLRKYYDSAVINVYANAYLQGEFSVTNLVVKEIESWMQDKENKLPRFGTMAAYLKTSSATCDLYQLLDSDDRYKLIRDRCNDHTHYNFYYYVMLNDGDIAIPSRLGALSQFESDLNNVITLHLSLLMYFSDHYMMASDYVDSLELGLLPEPNSQYRVAPFIQEAFDRFVATPRPDLAALIRQKSSMHLA